MFILIFKKLKYINFYKFQKQGALNGIVQYKNNLRKYCLKLNNFLKN